ncbi:MAG: type II secretion system F family protein [Syntrophomonadaceae bacterium]
MKYAYNVRTRQGKYLSGVLEAENREVVIQSLLAQNYSVLSLKEASTSSKEINISFARVKTRDLVLMTRQLATMISAGLSIIRCFNILEQQASNAKLKTALREVRQDISEGLPLWQALAKHPRIFSNIYVSMVKAGELGGMLDEVLERLCLHLEREQEINAKIKSASIYPAIISIFAIIMMMGIMIFVMPMFIDMFKSYGAELPAPTRMLIKVSDFLRGYWMFWIPAIVIIIYALKKSGKTEGGREFWDKLYLKLPVVGKTIGQIGVARFARTMGTLVRAGIPILQALEVMEEVAGNVVMKKAIHSARISITEGDSIAEPLAATGVFEPMVTQMIAVGEETGSLDDMLVRMSDYFEREVMHMVDALMAVLEPMLIIFVALMVGAIVIATLLPVFDIVSTVG